ncbi:MAG: hypothetical protein RJA57_1880 [Bacteroidota bacterium]
MSCRVFYILLVLFMGSAASAQQDTSFRLLRIMNGDMESFTVDNLDNVYVLTSRNQVKKYNAAGDSVAVFNDIRKYGRATLIDVSNPLKVLLYYRDFATVLMLDRFLNVVHVLDLRKQGVYQAGAIGQSFDNRVWVYDEMEARLKKLDENGTVSLQTPDFRMLFTQPFSPQKIFDEDRCVYLYDPRRGIYVFDYFGALKNGIQIMGWKDLRVGGNHIYGTEADTLRRYDIRSFRVDSWLLPEPARGSLSFRFSGTRVYALKPGCRDTGNCLYIYLLR